MTAYPYWGSPAFTFCDVERVVIQRLCAAGLAERLAAELAQEREAAERTLLNKLQAKYQPERPATPSVPRPQAGNWVEDQPSLL
jgi:hypothetical protein